MIEKKSGSLPKLHKSPFLDKILRKEDRKTASHEDITLFDNGRVYLCIPDEVRPAKDDPIWKVDCLGELLIEICDAIKRSPEKDLVENIHLGIESANSCILGFDLKKAASLDWNNKYKPLILWVTEENNENKIPGFGRSAEDVLGAPP